MIQTNLIKIAEFYAQYPEYMGQISVDTRHGLKPIEAAWCSAENSPVFEVRIGEETLKTSPDHLLMVNGDWEFVKNIKVGDKISTRTNEVVVTAQPKLLDYKDDLYDIQVEDVHEFYANNIVSHNSSCILDSLFFACFGKPFRNINIPNVVNSMNGKDCVVELYLSVNGKDYKVVRGLKPKIFEIYENGVLVEQDAHSKDYQEWFELYVLGGINEKIFRQVVIMGSANFVPFMQLPALQRREVIEELLDIKIFSNMLGKAKEKLVSIKESLSDLDSGISLAEEKLKLHQQNSKDAEEVKQTQIKQLNQSVDLENSEIEKLQSSIAVLSEKKASLLLKLTAADGCENTLKHINQEIADVNSKRKLIASTVAFFEKNETCPTCSQGIAHDHRHAIVTKNIDEQALLDDAAKELDAKLGAAKNIVSAYMKVQEKVRDIDYTISVKNSEISTKQKYIQKLQKEKSVLEKPNKAVAIDHKSLSSTVIKLKEKRVKLLEDRQYYEAICGMLKDGGIKTKIIRQYIPVFNKIINEYLQRFGLPIEFTLDEEFNEVIKARYRDKHQYNNFSEGERQRIDLALLLAWRQVAKSKNTLNTNLLIFDEIFDKSLDVSATDELLNILKEKDKKQTIMVISHKTDLSGKMDSIIEFEKKAGFTKIK